MNMFLQQDVFGRCFNRFMWCLLHYSNQIKWKETVISYHYMLIKSRQIQTKNALLPIVFHKTDTEMAQYIGVDMEAWIFFTAYHKSVHLLSQGVSFPPPSPAGPPQSWPGVSPPSPPMFWPAPPWSEASPPHSAPSAWTALSHSPGAPPVETEEREISTKTGGERPYFMVFGVLGQITSWQHLFQFEHLLLVLLVGSLTLVEKSLPLFLQPIYLLLQPTLLLV